MADGEQKAVTRNKLWLLAMMDSLGILFIHLCNDRLRVSSSWIRFRSTESLSLQIGSSNFLHGRRSELSSLNSKVLLLPDQSIMYIDVFDDQYRCWWLLNDERLDWWLIGMWSSSINLKYYSIWKSISSSLAFMRSLFFSLDQHNWQRWCYDAT